MSLKLKNIAVHFLRRYKPYIFLLSITFLLVVGWLAVNFSSVAKTASVNSQVFVIKKGESLSAVALRLEKENLIHNSLIFKIWVISRGLTKKIQPGSFKLTPALDVNQIVMVLIHGPSDVWITIPEGWRKEEIANRLTANLSDFDSKEFLKLVNSLEGKLFPDTYLIPQDTSASAVVEILNKNFVKKTAGLNLKADDLILASIVEREVKTDNDRSIVAGILKKRLQKGWPLQADATLQYAAANSKFEIRNSKLENWWAPLTKDDLKIDSPYNTYKYKGLPPTPICNPGLSSIKAVLNPRQTEFWYYLSDPQGQIHYAQTNEKHLQNIANFINN